jgi:hypothetical protein
VKLTIPASAAELSDALLSAASLDAASLEAASLAEALSDPLAAEEACDDPPQAARPSATAHIIATTTAAHNWASLRDFMLFFI